MYTQVKFGGNTSYYTQVTGCYGNIPIVFINIVETLKVFIVLCSIDDILLELQNIQALIFFCPRQAIRTLCL